MPRTLNRLTDRFVRTCSQSGRHSDGGGLYLSIRSAKSKSWVFMWSASGRQREMGLGSVDAITLARARDLATDARRALAEGKDPLDMRNAQRSKALTFGDAARTFHAKHAPSLKSSKTNKQWLPLLERHCAAIWSRPVAAISRDDVVTVLAPIWLSKIDTADRVRQRMEAVLESAAADGAFPEDKPNPAAKTPRLFKRLPTRPKVRLRRHHPAMPFADLPEFLSELRASTGISPRALEFTILTAARSGEVFGATWNEFDMDNAIWRLPAQRMKASKPHAVPLGPRALAILAELKPLAASPSAYVFPGAKPGKPLSVMAMTMLLRRMDRGHLTVHGFRSSFRDWAGEATSFPRELAELALAHRVGDETERAYRRGTALERRRELMHAWERFAIGSNVVTLASKRAGA